LVSLINFKNCQALPWNYNSKVTQLVGLQCFSTTSSNTKTHVDDQDKAAMVDVSAKDVTKCEAIACATVEVGAEITKLITRIVSKRAMHWRWHK